MNNEKIRTIKEKLNQGLGQASMAWSETPKGIFQDQVCTAIANDIFSSFESVLYDLEKRNAELKFRLDVLEQEADLTKRQKGIIREFVNINNIDGQTGIPDWVLADYLVASLKTIARFRQQTDINKAAGVMDHKPASEIKQQCS